STLQTAQHAYAQPGTYTVTLTVTDNEGATGQASASITVTSNNQLPVAVIQASKNQAEVNEDITFDGSGSSDSDGSITQYAWSFGDGGTSNQQTVDHAYASAGAYTVTLTVTDNEGGTGSASTQINILAEPSRLTVSPLSGTLGPGESQVITVTYDATTKVAGTYSGQVSLNSNGGNINLPVTITVDPTVDVVSPPDIPERFSLDQNYPNPFNPETTIQFTLEGPTTVRLVVFDVSGRVVRTLIDGSRMASGPHRVSWDARDGSGNPLASGTYFYRLDASAEGGSQETHFTRKMVLLR
ncbi:MAG: PKD domain-containing protein, partial [Rhodothermia bacterium]|nr:PKD domain-containing protein [Rhodothermia bacterium]